MSIGTLELQTQSHPLEAKAGCELPTPEPRRAPHAWLLLPLTCSACFPAAWGSLWSCCNRRAAVNWSHRTGSGGPSIPPSSSHPRVPCHITSSPQAGDTSAHSQPICTGLLEVKQTHKCTAQIQVKQENHLLYSGPGSSNVNLKKDVRGAVAPGSGCRIQSLAPLALGAKSVVRRLS